MRGRLGDTARVAEPALGERRRALAAVLALVLPARAGDVPRPLGGVPLEDFHRAVNRVAPVVHPCRRRRDELRAPRDPPLRARAGAALRRARGQDLPDAWNARFEELWASLFRTTRLGVLQDAHWSGGGFGYFPTYLLGTVLSVQIWEKAREALPDVDEQIERGEFGELHEWLRETIYSLGRKLTPAETIRRAVGGPLSP